MASGNLNFLNGSVVARSGVLFDFTDDVHSIDDFTEHHVSAVEPRRLLHRDEELRSVCVLTGVGHRQPAGSVVSELEVLVGEAFAVDRAASEIRKAMSSTAAVERTADIG